MTNRSMKLEVPDAFEDVAVDFSREEWKMLSNQDKELHREVMVQNYEHMVSVVCRGTQCNKTPYQMVLKKEPLNSECVKNFAGQMSATRDELIQTGNELHEYMEYDKSFKQENELKMHLQTHEMEVLYKADCKEGLVLPDNFVTYSQSHNEGRVMNEIITQNIIKNPKIFDEIKQEHEDKDSLTIEIKNFKCEFDESFTEEPYLADIQKIKIGEKSHTYDSNFSWRYQLTSHNKTHTGEKLYKCTTCDRSFQWKSTLVAHEKVHTGEKPYVCATCGKSYTLKGSLAYHEKTHTGEKPYKCSTCDKSFIMKCHLIAHEQTHTGKRPFQCAKCSKFFKKKGSLTDHEKIHTGEKPFKCTMCDKSFMWKCELTYHEKNHTGDRPYKCGICDKTFKKKYHLTCHEGSHTGEKPFKCSLCNKSFMRKWNLSHHMKGHMGVKPYKCAFCDKSFMWRRHMAHHEKLHTAEIQTVVIS
ncbi:zinc finger protein OZF-like isoform X2 [Protopterus annectens]|uniref:zinc finger protein OZF-like isoform X2 n=1 Tax=Protopterus annectens TaxID=7888 RepID=UPI001CFA5644|nr:zinc finger protein OZF-like isoform X2 [Protopterus annectens]